MVNCRVCGIVVYAVHFFGSPRSTLFGTGTKRAFVPFFKVNIAFPVGVVEVKEDFNVSV